MITRFDVTYEVWDDEAVEAGDTDCRGYISQEVSLRDAIEDVFHTRTSHVSGVDCIEPSDSRLHHARWFTVVNGMEFETGAYESRSLHIPDHVTGASRARIARLLGIGA